MIRCSWCDQAEGYCDCRGPLTRQRAAEEFDIWWGVLCVEPAPPRRAPLIARLLESVREYVGQLGWQQRRPISTVMLGPLTRAQHDELAERIDNWRDLRGHDREDLLRGPRSIWVDSEAAE